MIVWPVGSVLLRLCDCSEIYVQGWTGSRLWLKNWRSCYIKPWILYFFILLLRSSFEGLLPLYTHPKVPISHRSLRNPAVVLGAGEKLSTFINLRWISVYWEFKHVCGIECLHVRIPLWSFISLFFLTDILSINKITQKTQQFCLFFSSIGRRAIAVFPWVCFRMWSARKGSCIPVQLWPWDKTLCSFSRYISVPSRVVQEAVIDVFFFSSNSIRLSIQFRFLCAAFNNRHGHDAALQKWGRWCRRKPIQKATRPLLSDTR